jgi:hypothetical protein
LFYIFFIKIKQLAVIMRLRGDLMFKNILAALVLFSAFAGNPAFSQDHPESPSAVKEPQQEEACPTPGIKELMPRAAAAGAKVTIVGFGFGSSRGDVLFPGNLGAQIMSWQPQRIVVLVPPSAKQDGHVVVINGCSARSKDESGGYFKIVN